MTTPSLGRVPSSGKAPSLKKLSAAWAEADKEEAFWKRRYREYLEKYPDQFVAVLNGKVVAASPDLAEVIGILKTKGLSPKAAWIRFITANPRRTLL